MIFCDIGQKLHQISIFNFAGFFIQVRRDREDTEPLGVNFINVKCTHVSYESLFSSYVLSLNKLSYEKFAHKQ